MPKEFADLGLRYFDDDSIVYQIQEQQRKRKSGMRWKKYLKR